MKVIIASDIHGRVSATKRLEAVIKAAEPDKIILLGDYLYNGPRNGVPFDYDPMATATILNRYASIIVGVRGNCDSRVDASILRFPFQDSAVVHLNGYRCDLIHGDLLTSSLVAVERGDILMFGHTHVPMLKREDGVIYLNPGSIAFPKNGSQASYAYFVGSHIEIRRLEDDVPFLSLELY